ncbi:hypothetical protein [Prosthecobacter sp.]|uniref:hypothetical protein n=1 Tax=Prosthecobacter sp. TaxID=1965333 RepID=UPI003783B743
MPLPADLRPLLHEEVDRMSPDDLEVLHRVALQLELDRVSATLDSSFDEDRRRGRLEALPDIIQAARAALRVKGS